jgi:hypothetical protein
VVDLDHDYRRVRIVMNSHGPATYTLSHECIRVRLAEQTHETSSSKTNVIQCVVSSFLFSRFTSMAGRTRSVQSVSAHCDVGVLGRRPLALPDCLESSSAAREYKGSPIGRLTKGFYRVKFSRLDWDIKAYLLDTLLSFSFLPQRTAWMLRW